MRLLLIMATFVLFSACAHVPVAKDESSLYIAEYEDLLTLYEEFNTFKDEQAFIDDGFVEDSKYLHWLMDVQELQKKPGYSPEGSRVLTVLAMAYRQEGKDSFIYQQVEQSFTKLMDKARIEQDASIAILYTGDTLGKLVPLQREKVPSGGLARRAAMISTIRERERHVLVFDAGDTFFAGPENNRINETMVQAMNAMGYDALGLGQVDFSLGEQELKNLVSLAKFPIICSNLVFEDGLQAWIAPHVVLNSAKARIGVLSIVPPDFDNPIQGAHFIGPREAINRQIQLLQGQVDAFVLLTQYDALAIAAILDPDDPIVVVFSDAQGGALDNPKYIFPTVPDGLAVGFFRMVQTGSGQLEPAAQSIIALTGLAEDEAIFKMVNRIK